MYNTYLTSRISLSSRTRATHSFNDYSHDRQQHPFACYPSFSRPSSCCYCYCYCYTNSMMYKTPICPSYCYSLYGLRQSSLIQCRKLISGGYYYSRLPVSNVDRSCTCDKVCTVRGKSVGGGSKGGSGKCVMAFEDRSESCDFDEAEVLLSLLSEGIGKEEPFRVKKETKRSIKKGPVMEKRESGEVGRKKCGGKKKRIVIDIMEGESSCECEYESVGFGSRIKDNRREERVQTRDGGKRRGEMVDVSDGEPSCEYESLVSGSRNKDNRRGERIRRKEDLEALSREENRNMVLREKNEESLLSNRTKRAKEERDSLLRKARLKDEEKQEREFMSRKENWKVMERKEEREDLSRREEQRNRMRKDGSSCSSYYSVFSTGDYGSDDEIELGGGRYIEESSSGYKRNSRNSERDQRHEGRREDHNVSLINKSNAKGSSVFESDFRKKSEKKLADVPVEEIEPRKETTGNQSKFLVDRDSKYGKTYDYYVGYDDRKVKSNESMEVEERRELNRQTGNDSRQYKQFVEMHDNRSHVRNSPKVASSSQETVGERRTAVGFGSRDDEYHRRNSHRVAEVSEIQEIDRRKTYISQQDIDIRKTKISREEIETNIKKQDSRSNDVSYSYGSQLVNSGKNDVPVEVASVSHETVGAHQAAVGYGSRDDEYYRRNSDKIAAVSEIQEIDLRKTSVSQQETDFRKTSVSQQETDFRKTSVSQEGTGTIFEKKKDNSTNVLSSINDDAWKQESRGKSQQLAIKKGTSVLKRQSDDKRVRQEQNMNLDYGSSLESKEQHSQTYAERTGNSRNESNEFTKITITHPGDFVAADIEDRNKTKSNMLVKTPSSALPVESNIGSTSNKVGGLQFGSTGPNLEESQEQPTKFISHEDAIGSAARQEKFSARYVDSFVDKVKNEILSSEIQGEKKTNETKNADEEQQGQTSLAQTSSGDSASRHFGTKGPSDEMWDVDKLSVKPEVQGDNASRGSIAIVRGSGRSIWNVIADIVHLRWSARSEGHSSGRRTGRRSSPIQSMSSEMWFSGHEAEEHVETARDKEGGNTTQGGRQEEKTRLQVEEGSSSSSLEGRLKHVGSNAPSSSSAAIVDSTSSPAHKLQKSPVVKRDSESGEARTSASGTSEQLNTGSIDQAESSVSKGELKQRKLGRKDQIGRDRFDEWEEAYRLEAEQQKIDEMFMREALVEAKKAADNWEVPVGAVLVQNGTIIARGCNLVEELRDSTAHAEMICIREASNALRTWRLSDTTLYVTLEPCPMCAGAILQARIDTVVWGAPNKLLGADGSWIRLFPSGDGNELDQSDKPPAPIHPFHSKIVIRRRVLASECADAMQQFFQLRRKKKDNKPDPPNTPPSCLPISHHHPSKFLSKMHDAFHLMFCL